MDRDALELVESDVPKTFPQWVLLARLKLSTATKIESVFLCVIGNPNKKSTKISTHGFSGIGRGRSRIL